MRIVEKSVIKRPAAQVWPYIISPEHFKVWNDKVVSMGAKGHFVPHQIFVSQYKMSGKETQCASTVSDIQENRLLELRHENLIGQGIRTDMVVTERITLKESRGTTTVMKEVIVQNHGVPLIFQLLIWFVNRFGTRKGPDKLKQLCEGGTAP